MSPEPGKSGLTLVIGNRNYSSWSMRPWLALRELGLPFETVRIPLYGPDSKAQIARYSPAGKVPVLLDGKVAVWDSLAILEHLAERHPERALWPRDPGGRARARAIAAEMHSGFAALRSELPMNLRADLPGHRWSPAAADDIARIEAMWRDCLARSGGPFLFGAFSAADAMYAPVVGRFLVYHVPLGAEAARYAATIRALPAAEEWWAAARAETEVLPQFEKGPAR